MQKTPLDTAHAHEDNRRREGAGNLNNRGTFQWHAGGALAFGEYFRYVRSRLKVKISIWNKYYVSTFSCPIFVKQLSKSDLVFNKVWN